MDPFSALSIATAVLQFVEFSTKLLSGARKIYYSTTGSTVDNAALTLVAKEIEAWSSRLRTSRVSNARVTEENALHRLAAECETLSRELLQLIRRNIPSDPKSKCAALCAAFKDKLHDKEKQQLLERVKECRQQLTVQLETLDRSELKKQLQKLAEESLERFVLLQKKLDSLNADLTYSVSTDIPRLIQGLLDIPSHALAEARILQSMVNTSMHQRENQIDEAHFKTFRWIVDENVHTHEPYRTRFNEWLRKGTGVFHIAGKLGSGKSTLKFLSTHQNTMERLKQWAGTRRLVLARFFFWGPGAEAEKTLDGLLCGLLHDVLEQCPEYIPAIFPEQWKESIRSDRRVRLQFQFSREDIRAAFNQLLHKGTI